VHANHVTISLDSNDDSIHGEMRAIGSLSFSLATTVSASELTHHRGHLLNTPQNVCNAESQHRLNHSSPGLTSSTAHRRPAASYLELQPQLQPLPFKTNKQMATQDGALRFHTRERTLRQSQVTIHPIPRNLPAGNVATLTGPEVGLHLLSPFEIVSFSYVTYMYIYDKKNSKYAAVAISLTPH